MGVNRAETCLMRLATALYSVVISIWVGGQAAVGYIAAPVLFSQLADRTLAGNLAGAMFSVMAWVGMGCGAYLLLYLVMTQGAAVRRSAAFWLVVLMVAATLAGHFGIGPVLAQLKAAAAPQPVMESALRERFTFWHGASSLLYLLQTLLGVALVLRQSNGRT
jgi:hypothetical protein